MSAPDRRPSTRSQRAVLLATSLVWTLPGILAGALGTILVLLGAEELGTTGLVVRALLAAIVGAVAGALTVGAPGQVLPQARRVATRVAFPLGLVLGAPAAFPFLVLLGQGGPRRHATLGLVVYVAAVVAGAWMLVRSEQSRA